MLSLTFFVNSPCWNYKYVSVSSVDFNWYRCLKSFKLHASNSWSVLKSLTLFQHTYGMASPLTQLCKHGFRIYPWPSPPPWCHPSHNPSDPLSVTFSVFWLHPFFPCPQPPPYLKVSLFLARVKQKFAFFFLKPRSDSSCRMPSLCSKNGTTSS